MFKKRFLPMIVAVALILGVMPVGTYSAAGDDFDVDAFDIQDGVLVRYYGEGGDVTIPDSVTAIGDNAFRGCAALTGVTIPDSVTAIGAAFLGCESLTINVANGNANFKAVDGVLYNKAGTNLIQCPQGKIGAVTIPPSVTAISNVAFTRCAKITDVTIPDSVTQIGSFAFYNCNSLTGVAIPDSVTAIGGGAFGYVFDGETDIKIENFTIYSTPGTAAEEYAKDNEFKFVATGYLNGNGEASQADVNLLAKFASGQSVTLDQTLADLDDDGVEDMRDATYLARAIAGWEGYALK